MAEHELEKLLGGFAADTLTPEERQKLFEAALQEQQLFTALADEQALKELLTDPVVRRRLLDAFPQTSLSRSSGSLSWWEWLRRPVGLTFAGGLAAVVVAIVIGTKIYQDSLKQAAQSVATEEARPTASPAPAPPASQPARPSIVEPQPKARESAGPTKEKDALRAKMAKQERPSTPPSQPQEQRASESTGDRVQRTEPDEVRKQADAPVLRKAERDATGSDDRKPAPPQNSANAPGAGTPTSPVGAKALFYEEETVREDRPASLAEREPHVKAFSEAPRTGRLGPKAEPFASAGQASGEKMRLKPLGLRYSFMIRGSDGQEQEVDAITASRSLELIRLTVKTNQDAHLQVWTTAPSSKPQLLFPNREAGRISHKVYADTREDISLPTNSGPLTLTLRLSRVPFGPITRQESAMLDRHSANQLTESVTPGSPTGSQERATYVVNQDSTPTAQITVDIPPGR